MNKRMLRKRYKEFVYGSSIWRIDINQNKDNSFCFEVLEKAISLSDKSEFITVEIYNNPREAIRDIKKIAI